MVYAHSAAESTSARTHIAGGMVRITSSAYDTARATSTGRLPIDAFNPAVNTYLIKIYNFGTPWDPKLGTRAPPSKVDQKDITGQLIKDRMIGESEDEKEGA